jgi:hypothetical protein
VTQLNTTTRHPAGRITTAVITAWLTFVAFTAAAALRLRGDLPVDDRGSDSTEKSLMVILAASAGAAVTVAALAFIATKTSLFK